MKKRVGRVRATGRTKIGQDLIRGMREAVAWARGRKGAIRVTEVIVPQVDVRAVRKRTGLSQDEFAAKFGFARASVRNWEQGRRRPEGPARILLAVIEHRPEVVEAVLRRAS